MLFIHLTICLFSSLFLKIAFIHLLLFQFVYLVVWVCTVYFSYTFLFSCIQIICMQWILWRHYHWINSGIGSDQIMHRTWNECIHKVYNLQSFLFLSFFLLFLINAAQKKALADKKGVFVRTIITTIAHSPNLCRCFFLYHEKENCTKEEKFITEDEWHEKKSEVVYLLWKEKNFSCF